MSMSVNKHPRSSFSSSPSSTPPTTNQPPSSSTSSSTAGQRLFNGVPVDTLHDFMCRDIQPEGPRVLLPFLTTTDLLRQSSCSRGLLKYRSHLTDIKIFAHSSPVSDNSMFALTQLLLRQEGRLQRLRLRDSSAAKALQLGAMRLFKGLKTLELECDLLNETDAASVGRALSGGGFECLEELKLSCDDEGLRDGVRVSEFYANIMQPLAEGACPGLRRLTLHHIARGHSGHGVVTAWVARAIESGHLQKLQHLDLSRSTMSRGSMLKKLQALQSGCCPDLRSLNLMGCDLLDEDYQALAELLMMRGCPNLEELRLDGGTSFFAVMEALAAGSCPNLRELVIREEVSATAARALGNALGSGCCSRLRHLDLCGALKDQGAALRVLRGIGGAACRDLEVLNLGENCLRIYDGELLGQALREEACPRLKKLLLTDNESLGDGGVLFVAEALRDGSCRDLEVLCLRRVGMGPAACTALAQALKSGSLSCLRDLNLNDNMGIGNKAINDLVIALGRQGANCPHLRGFHILNTGEMGSS